MAITNTWSVTDMTRVDADGGVINAYWSCLATQTEGEGDAAVTYTAVEGGKLLCTYDASAAGFIAYASLTEANVLGWVYASLVEGDETPDEAKARIEADRTAKVQKQIDRAATQDTGVPW